MNVFAVLSALSATTLAVVVGALLLAAGAATHAERADALVELSPPSTSARACKGCGWIESRREDQYTVRMRDGTSRVFDETPGVKWRLGERLNYID